MGVRMSFWDAGDNVGSRGSGDGTTADPWKRVGCSPRADAVEEKSSGAVRVRAGRERSNSNDVNEGKIAPRSRYVY